MLSPDDMTERRLKVMGMVMDDDEMEGKEDSAIGYKSGIHIEREHQRPGQGPLS